MEIEFKNFAKAGSGKVHINDLTIICGPNNSGKTYINYAIFSILGEFRNLFDIGLSKKEVKNRTEELLSKGYTEFDITHTVKNIDNCKKNTVQEIRSNFEHYFGVPENHFSGFELSLDIGKINTKVSNKIDLSKFYGIVCNYKNKNNSVIVSVRIDMSSEKRNYLKNIENKEEKCKFVKYLINAVLLNTVFTELRRPFPITSERTGISLFYKLFDSVNTNLVEEIKNIENLVDVNSVIGKRRSDYALPILKNIEIVRSYGGELNNKSIFANEKKSNNYLIKILNNLLDNGKFKVNAGLINYIPEEKFGKTDPATPLHATSSSLKALFLLDLFVKHVAHKNHIVIIDEPELNLFPVNQALMARLIARLVNSGIKVLVTTHSDYFVREINNLISLSNANEHKEEVMNKYDFKNEEILEKNQVSAYQTTADGIIEMRITNYGIDTKVLDSIISRENLKADEIAEIVVDDYE